MRHLSIPWIFGVTFHRPNFSVGGPYFLHTLKHSANERNWLKIVWWLEEKRTCDQNLHQSVFGLSDEHIEKELSCKKSEKSKGYQEICSLRKCKSNKKSKLISIHIFIIFLKFCNLPIVIKCESQQKTRNIIIHCF